MIPIGLKACGIALFNSAYPRTFIYISRRRRFHCRMVRFCCQLPCYEKRNSMISPPRWTTPERQLARCASGLRHGAVTNFASEGEASNPIDPARPAKAKLDYLALGHFGAYPSDRTSRSGCAGRPRPPIAQEARARRGLLALRDIPHRCTSFRHAAPPRHLPVAYAHRAVKRRQ